MNIDSIEMTIARIMHGWASKEAHKVVAHLIAKQPMSHDLADAACNFINSQAHTLFDDEIEPSKQYIRSHSSCRHCGGKREILGTCHTEGCDNFDPEWAKI